MNTNEERSIQSMRVLVAEDNAVNQKVIKIILEKNGCSFSIAEDGAKAIEEFRHGSYDLILMDCQMPEVDGLQASRRIREWEEEAGRGRCPIVAMTANAMKGDRDRCLEAGMDDFLAKPFKSQDLLNLMEEWARKRGPQ